MRHTYAVHPLTDGGSTGTGQLRPGISVGQVFAFVAGFVALAAVGAVIGWTNTKLPSGNPGATGPTSVVSTPPTGPSLSPSPSVSVSPSTPTSPTATGPTIPDYAAAGTDFQTARNELLAQKMGVTLQFDEADTSVPQGTVERTQPPAGTPIRKGITVKIVVAGAAPPLAVPPPADGVNCETYAKALVATGFNIEYAGVPILAKRLFPMSTDPMWGNTSTWTAKIRLTCTKDGTASPTPPDTSSPTPTDTPTG